MATLKARPTLTTDGHRAEMVRLLRAYKAASQDFRTSVLREFAEHVVSVREHFLTAEGNPDYLGKTHAYRAWTRDLFSDAGYSKDEATSTQASARYHVSTVLRQRLSEDTLDELGLQSNSARERSAERREKRTLVTNAVLHHEASGSGVLLTLGVAYNLLRGVNVAELPEMTPNDAEAARNVLFDLASYAHLLVEKLP